MSKDRKTKQRSFLYEKIITTLATLCIASSLGITAHAAEILDKDYIESEIWTEIWLGKGDDGTEYPEASYKHHLLDEWIDENYGSDEYDWTELGELKYEYKDYYNRLIAEWDFNDDRNGNWTIDTEDNSYRFQLVGGQWNMIDKNGDTVDSFPIFSTLEENPDYQPLDDSGSSGNRVIGSVESKAETPTVALDSENDKVTANSTEKAVESVSERSENSAIPIAVGCLAVVGIGVVGIILYKKRK